MSRASRMCPPSRASRNESARERERWLLLLDGMVFFAGGF